MRAVNYARTITKSASGVGLDRPCKVSAFAVTAVNTDCVANLRDGGSTGTIRWTLEADNAGPSATQSFNPPLIFDRNLYIEMDGGTQSKVNVAVLDIK